VITETLEPTTAVERQHAREFRQQLSAAVSYFASGAGPYQATRSDDPLAIWVELNLGIEQAEGRWVRAVPKTLAVASDRLSEECAEPRATCEQALKNFLTFLGAQPAEDREPLLAFKLHQFISGASKLYSTIEPPCARLFSLLGQRYALEDRSHVFFHTHFCRQCGQEYHPARRSTEGAGEQLSPRDIEDSVEDESAESTDGFFMPEASAEGEFPAERLPDSWLEEHRGELRVKSHYRRAVPQCTRVRPDGAVGSGLAGWWIPGRFKFCPACGTSFDVSGKDYLRLVGLSGEGRSSATTVITISSVLALFRAQELDVSERKVLSFADNRQDAALQAGHFNDFVNVVTLRSALLRHLKERGLLEGDADLGNAIFDALGFGKDDLAARSEYLIQPYAIASALRGAQSLLRDLLAYRVVLDLRRGWRYNNPNLEQLGWMSVTYADLDEVANTPQVWTGAPLELKDAPAPIKLRLLNAVCDALRMGLCIESRFLDPREQEKWKGSDKTLKWPWAIESEREARPWKVMVPSQANLPRAALAITASGGFASVLGRALRKSKNWEGSRSATPSRKPIIPSSSRGS
jgi:hypothetical protein